MTRYWEDFAVGDVFELGEYRLERDELLAFARRYDPQPFHVDDAAAAAGPFGGLAASGWHTAAIWMRLYALSLLADCVSLGSPGIRGAALARPGAAGDAAAGSGDRRRGGAVQPASRPGHPVHAR